MLGCGCLGAFLGCATLAGKLDTVEYRPGVYNPDSEHLGTYFTGLLVGGPIGAVIGVLLAYPVFIVAAPVYRKIGSFLTWFLLLVIGLVVASVLEPVVTRVVIATMPPQAPPVYAPSSTGAPYFSPGAASPSAPPSGGYTNAPKPKVKTLNPALDPDDQ